MADSAQSRQGEGMQSAAPEPSESKPSSDIEVARPSQHSPAPAVIQPQWSTAHHYANDYRTWAYSASEQDRMLSSREVADLLGYKSKSAFWDWVKRAQPPRVRLNARNIRFPQARLKAWLDQRSSYTSPL